MHFLSGDIIRLGIIIYKPASAMRADGALHDMCWGESIITKLLLHILYRAAGSQEKEALVKKLRIIQNYLCSFESQVSSLQIPASPAFGPPHDIQYRTSCSRVPVDFFSFLIIYFTSFEFALQLQEFAHAFSFCRA